MTSVVHPLRFPIAFTSGDEARTIEEVTVRRPIAKDFLATDGVQGDVAKSLAMIEQLTGLMRVQVEKLDGVDMAAIGSIIEGFMEPGPQTGATL